MTSPFSDLSESTGQLWDVIIIGAGPAGALAARQIASSGASVLLVERKALSRWKVCGCCLNAAALSTLTRVSLGDVPAKLGAVPLQRIVLAARDCQAEVAMSGGVSVSREAFDTALISAAINSGAEFLSETNARLGHWTTDFREVTLNRAGDFVKLRSKLVLAADGLGGSFIANYSGCKNLTEVSSRIGAGTVIPNAPNFIVPGTVYMACSDGGYVGLVRLEDGRLDVAAAFDRSTIDAAGGLAPAAANIIREVGWPQINDLLEIPWRGTVLLHNYPPRLSCNRVLVLGDAAGYVEPFTGEGIAWALASAVSVAPLAIRAIERWDVQIERDWAVSYHRVVQSRQSICRFIARTLRHPQLLRNAIHMLHYFPNLSAPIFRRLNAPFDLSEGTHI